MVKIGMTRRLDPRDHQRSPPCLRKALPPALPRLSDVFALGSRDGQRPRANRLSRPLNFAAYGPGQPQPPGLSRTRRGRPRPAPREAVTGPLVRGCFRWWWQGLGSNQRRLSRRFYREPPTRHRNAPELRQYEPQFLIRIAQPLSHERPVSAMPSRTPLD
jgi:hypothetical protein